MVFCGKGKIMPGTTNFCQTVKGDMSYIEISVLKTARSRYKEISSVLKPSATIRVKTQTP